MLRIIKRIFTLCCALVVLIGCFPACSGNGNTDDIMQYNLKNAVSFDYSKIDGTKTQYIKKFDQFATTWGFVGDLPGYINEESIHQLSAISDLNAESMRFDLFMGYTGVGYGIGNSSEKNGTTDEEYAQAMQVITELIKNGINPQLVLFACPAYAQSYGSWKSKPVAEKWEELCYNIANYFKEKGIRMGAYEIWNEPDLGNAYFDGDWQDYIETYLSGVKGIKQADKDAFVEAISASWIHNIVNNKSEDGTLTQWESFLKQSSEANAIPDSISWHFYGREGKLEDIKGLSGDGENFSVYRNAILEALNNSQNGTSANDSTKYDLTTLQQHLNEFNIYVPLHEDSRSMWNSTEVVSGMFNAIDTLLNANDITRVNWATFLSEQSNGIGCSSIDLYSLQRYPAYYVNWMYGRMPITRIYQPEIEGVETLAGVDSGRASLIVYNNSDSEKNVTVKLDNIPFAKGNVKVYQLDENHLTYSTVNDPCVVFSAKNVETSGLSAKLKLIKNAVYYIEVNNADGTEVDFAYNALRENIVRKDYYYPTRGNNTPYSDIHERSLYTVLSMNGNQTGKTAVDVTLKDMNDKTIAISYNLFGNYEQNSDAALGFKINYETTEGYTKSVYYSFENMSSDLILPFGTKKTADDTKTIVKNGTSGTQTVNLAAEAPSNWTGRITISYLMQNTGSDTVATFKIN